MARKLVNRKQEKFCRAYVAGADAITAYKEAGYKWADESGKVKRFIQNSIYDLLGRSNVEQRIEQLQNEKMARAEAERCFGIDWVRNEHYELLQEARESGDLAVATRNVELIGKTYGSYSDKIVVDTERIEEFTEARQIACREIATAILQQNPKLAMLPAPNAAVGVIDGEIEDD